MNRQQRMHIRALLSMKTGNKDSGKSDELANLVTNNGKEIDRLEASFPEKSRPEVEITKRISEALARTKIKIDSEALGGVIEREVMESQEIGKKLFQSYGITENSSEMYKVSILNGMGIPVKNIKKEELMPYKSEPLVETLLRKLKLDESINIFKSLENSQKDGIIIPEFSIFGSLSGRIISYSPSLQNFPSHYKNYIQPLEEGHSIYELDVISSEIIALAYLAEEHKIFELLSEKRDIYKFVGSHLFSKTESEITPEIRKVVKTLANGINLGMVGSSVAKYLNGEEIVKKKITPKKGEEIRRKYFDLFPKINKYLKEIIDSEELCTAHGHIIKVTPSYKHMSFPGQNLVAALLKETIIDLHEKNLFDYVVNLVHDSLIISCPDDQIEKIRSVCQEVFSTMIPDEFKDKNIDLLKLTKITNGGK